MSTEKIYHDNEDWEPKKYRGNLKCDRCIKVSKKDAQAKRDYTRRKRQCK